MTDPCVTGALLQGPTEAVATMEHIKNDDKNANTTPTKNPGEDMHSDSQQVNVGNNEDKLSTSSVPTDPLDMDNTLNTIEEIPVNASLPGADNSSVNDSRDTSDIGKKVPNGDALTDVSADEELPENDGVTGSAIGSAGSSTAPASPTAVVSSSKKSRPPYKYDPDKITLRFLFASRDGLAVTVECKPGDTVGEVKGALLSVWPEDMPVKVDDLGGDNLRLICMGKGFLMPDTRTLEDCQVPVFKTHPTPINVSIKPQLKTGSDEGNKNSTKKNKRETNSGSSVGLGTSNSIGGTTSGASNNSIRNGSTPDITPQGCCIIL